MNISEFMPSLDEKPLDRLVSDGGFTGIFRTIACIGDSLSSGEFESYSKKNGKGYHDYFEYSWGQYIARAAGCKVYNFSRGGMSAKEYMESFSKYKDFWNEDKNAQAYIIALGVNDLFGMWQEVGKVEDTDDREGTSFASFYGKILRNIKAHQPHARIFLMTMPREGADDTEVKKQLKEDHAELLYRFAEVFDNTYVLDFYKYAPVYDEAFKKQFFLGGHLNPAGYMLTAKMVMSYIDYIIRNNMEDFAQVPFIDKPYYNEEYKR